MIINKRLIEQVGNVKLSANQITK